MSRAERRTAGSAVDRAVLLRGYAEARNRFHAARLGREPAPSFLPLFEALNWAASIDEGLKFPDHQELRGLRFARNRVHHQWADALYVTDGMELPTTLPTVFFEWRWRRDLSPGRASRDEAAYLEHLADRPARRTLDAVAEFLDAL